MFTTIAIVWLWITLVVLGAVALVRISRFGFRLYLAITMARAWKREESR